ncbi:MAG: SH3 domain-containing protein [Spirochaetaceae bacterium]|nr:SH3 domain-containing protein [Spirochaetaceae bacterium]
MNFGDLFLYLAICLIVTFIIILITRELWCWYLKINARKTLLEEQNALLKKILANLENSNSEQKLQKSPASNESSPSKEMIVAQSVVLRKEANYDSGSLTKLYEDDIVVLNKINNEWSLVTTKKGESGWCYSSCLKPANNN